jgi:hypothetical protein
MERAPHIVMGRVLSARQTQERYRPQFDPLVVARVEVVRNVKGKLPKRIIVASEGFDNGANCGYGSELLTRRGAGPVPLVLGEKPDRAGRYYIGGCSQQLTEADLPSAD